MFTPNEKNMFAKNCREMSLARAQLPKLSWTLNSPLPASVYRSEQWRTEGVSYGHPLGKRWIYRACNGNKKITFSKAEIELIRPKYSLKI